PDGGCSPRDGAGACACWAYAICSWARASRSGRTSSRPRRSSSGSSAATPSTATWTCSRSRSPSVPGTSPARRPPRLISETAVCSRTSSTVTFFSSASSAARISASVGSRLVTLRLHPAGAPERVAGHPARRNRSASLRSSCHHLLGVRVGGLLDGGGEHLVARGPRLDHPPLALGAVELGQRDLDAELRAHRRRPVQQAS